jgi:hypothetical protein
MKLSRGRVGEKWKEERKGVLVHVPAKKLERVAPHRFVEVKESSLDQARWDCNWPRGRRLWLLQLPDNISAGDEHRCASCAERNLVKG